MGSISDINRSASFGVFKTLLESDSQKFVEVWFFGVAYSQVCNYPHFTQFDFAVDKNQFEREIIFCCSFPQTMPNLPNKAVCFEVIYAAMATRPH